MLQPNQKAGSEADPSGVPRSLRVDTPGFDRGPEVLSSADHQRRHGHARRELLRYGLRWPVVQMALQPARYEHAGAESELESLLETADPLRSPRNAGLLAAALERAVGGEIAPTSLDELKRDVGLADDDAE